MTEHIRTAFSNSPFAITLFTTDLSKSKIFYGTALGLQQVYEDEVSAVYSCGQTMINLLADSQAPDLVAPAQAGRPERISALYTLRCADVDSAVAELLNAGVRIPYSPPCTSP
jgi:lactoylglutathione lyase